MLARRDWAWFIANFCVLANGLYIGVAWLDGDRYLDTAQLFKHGAHPVTVAVYCIIALTYGYLGFRKSCISMFRSEVEGDTIDQK